MLDSPLWFIGALIVCGAHTLNLRSWRRERREYQARWQRYDVVAQQRHDEAMRALRYVEADTIGWNLDGSRKRGQA